MLPGTDLLTSQGWNTELQVDLSNGFVLRIPELGVHQLLENQTFGSGADYI